METQTPKVDAKNPTTRGRRKQNSRRKLLDAGKRLFVERGYHDTRPQDISREAGVGHGTFYLHFSDKRECFLAFVDEAQQGLETEIQRHTKDATDFSSRIEGVLKGIIAYSKANPKVLTAATANPDVIGAGEDASVPLPQRWSEQWMAAMIIGIREGEISDEYDPHLIGHAITGLVTFACNYAAQEGVEQDLLIENVTSFLVKALKSAT